MPGMLSPWLYSAANQDAEGLNRASKVAELAGGRCKIRTQTQASTLALASWVTVDTASSLQSPPKSLLLPDALKPCLLQGALQDPDLLSSLSPSWAAFTPLQALLHPSFQRKSRKGTFFFFCLFRATPAAHGGSQVRGPSGAVAASLHQSHSNVGSKPHL